MTNQENCTVIYSKDGLLVEQEKEKPHPNKVAGLGRKSQCPVQALEQQNHSMQIEAHSNDKLMQNVMLLRRQANACGFIYERCS